jgi:uncharacterized membrane protein
MMFIWVFVLIGLFYIFYDKVDIPRRRTFEDILDERLAKGEITIEEYNQLKKVKR